MKWSYLDLSSQECKTRQFPAIDIMKLLCAVLVVSIHTSPLSSINKYLDFGLVQYIARLAVPFFFIASGYFCFRKTTLRNFNSKIPFAYAKRLFALYIIWTLIYLPQIGYSILENENGIIWGIFTNIRMFIFVGYHHLWYLLAIVIAILIITIALKRRLKIEKILLFGGILYVIGLLGQSYFELLRPLEGTVVWTILKLYAKVFATTRNGIFEGILFVGIGALFAYRRIVIKKNVAIMGLISSMIFLLIEAFCVQYFALLREFDLYIFLVPAAFFIFYIVSHIEMKTSAFSRKARTYSSLIYFTHSWIYYPIVPIINKIIGKSLGIEEYTMHSLLQFCIVMIGALIATYMITHLQNYRAFRWLRKLY